MKKLFRSVVVSDGVIHADGLWSILALPLIAVMCIGAMVVLLAKLAIYLTGYALYLAGWGAAWVLIHAGERAYILGRRLARVLG